ncbi:MAG: PHP domain-containing protein, partial [Lapillicoccus sp.]
MNLLEPLSAPVSPTEALRRIAFLLERSRAGTYRVEAFRKAAKVIATVSDDELLERTEAKTLTTLAGVGDSTAAVIGQAVRGVLP